MSAEDETENSDGNSINNGIDSSLDQGGIHPITITAEMRKSYLDYAMSVIVSRALPDV